MSDNETSRAATPDFLPEGSPLRVQRPRQFREPARLMLGVFLALVGWLLAGGALAALVAMIVKSDRIFGFLFLGLFGGFVLFRILSYLQGLRLKCQLCHGPILQQKRCHMHRNAAKFGPLSYRNSTVLDIIGDGVFRCMYCGTPYRLRK